MRQIDILTLSRFPLCTRAIPELLCAKYDFLLRPTKWEFPLCAGQFRNCTDSHFAQNIYIKYQNTKIIGRVSLYTETCVYAWYSNALKSYAARPMTYTEMGIWIPSLMRLHRLAWTIAVLYDEPRHEKTCLCHMRTTKAQISLRIHTVWSAPLLFAAWIV